MDGLIGPEVTWRPVDCVPCRGVLELGECDIGEDWEEVAAVLGCKALADIVRDAGEVVTIEVDGCCVPGDEWWLWLPEVDGASWAAEPLPDDAVPSFDEPHAVNAMTPRTETSAALRMEPPHSLEGVFHQQNPVNEAC